MNFPLAGVYPRCPCLNMPLVANVCIRTQRKIFPCHVIVMSLVTFTLRLSYHFSKTNMCPCIRWLSELLKSFDEDMMVCVIIISIDWVQQM